MNLLNGKKLFVLVLSAGAFLASSCAPTLSSQYTEPGKAKVLDDKWNYKDTQVTMKSMLTSALGRPWLKNFKKGHGGKLPVVAVQDIQNRTDEHIDTLALTEFMETELVNSGEVKFLEKARRDQVMEEQEFQNSGAVAESSKKKTGNMIGADFLLVGAISSDVHSQGKEKNITYQVQMKFVNIETSEIAWTEKQAISKEFKSSGADW